MESKKKQTIIFLLVLTLLPLISAVQFDSGTIIKSNGLNTQITFDNSGGDRDATATNVTVDETFILFYDLVVEVADKDYTCSVLNITNRNLILFSADFTGYCTSTPGGGTDHGGATGGGTTIDSGDIENTTNVEVIGNSNETFSIINFDKIEILNSRLCNGEDRLRFKTLNSDLDFTIIESSELYLNNTKKSIKLFLDLTNEEYYFNLENLIKGEIEVKIVGFQDGVRIEEVQILNVERCMGFREYSENKLTSIINFIKDNPDFFLYTLGGIIFLIILSYLIYKLK